MAIDLKTFSTDLSLLPDVSYVYTTNFAAAVRPGQIILVASSASGQKVQESVEIWLDHSAGASYDALLWSGTFGGRASLIWTPPRGFCLDNGSELRIVINNRNRIGVVYGSIAANPVEAVVDPGVDVDALFAESFWVDSSEMSAEATVGSVSVPIWGRNDFPTGIAQSAPLELTGAPLPIGDFTYVAIYQRPTGTSGFGNQIAEFRSLDPGGDQYLAQFVCTGSTGTVLAPYAASGPQFSFADTDGNHVIALINSVGNPYQFWADGSFITPTVPGVGQALATVGPLASASYTQLGLPAQDAGTGWFGNGFYFPRVLTSEELTAFRNAITFPAAPPVITSSLAVDIIATEAFSYQITATGGATLYSSMGLPDGLSLNPATGAITGAPTSSGITNVLIGAKNAGGFSYQTLVIAVRAAVLSGLKTYVSSGTGGTLDGLPVSSFPDLFAAMNSGAYASAMTIGLRSDGTADASIGFTDSNPPESQRTFNFYDQNGMDENIEIGTGASSDLSYYAIDPAAGDFFFLATDGTARKSGSPISPTGTLPTFSSGTYGVGSAINVIVLAWPRVLSTTEMDEVLSLYSPA